MLRGPKRHLVTGMLIVNLPVHGFNVKTEPLLDGVCFPSGARFQRKAFLVSLKRTTWFTIGPSFSISFSAFHLFDWFLWAWTADRKIWPDVLYLPTTLSSYKWLYKWMITCQVTPYLLAKCGQGMGVQMRPAISIPTLHSSFTDWQHITHIPLEFITRALSCCPSVTSSLTV